MIKKIFRHKLVDVYMIICITIAMATIMIGIRYYNSAYDYCKDKEASKYQYEYKINLYKDFENFKDEDYDFMSLFDGENKLNIVIENIQTYRIDQGMTLVDYIVCLNDVKKIPFIKGGYNKKQKYDKPSIIVGRNIYNSNGKRDTVNYGGVEYQIIGVVGSDKSDLWDDEQMIILESVTDETRQNLLCGNCLCFRFLTNDSKDVAAIDGYAKKFNEIKGRIVSDEGYDNYSSDGTMEDFDNTIVYLIYGFAIVNCLFSAVLWVYVRMQEIVISRICGMSSTRVFFKLVMEIFVVCSCACIALVICAFAIKAVTGMTLIVISVRDILMIAGSVIMTTLLISLAPIYILNKKELYTMLIESGVM